MPTNITKEEVFAKLREIGATSVILSYSGGGDSGQTDSVIIKRGDDLVPADSVIFARLEVQKSKPLEGGDWISYVDMEDKPLEWAIEQIAESYFDQLEYDWWNNDGGFGELHIDMAGGMNENGEPAPRVWFEHNQNHTETSFHEQEVS